MIQVLSEGLAGTVGPTPVLLVQGESLSPATAGASVVAVESGESDG